MGIEVVIDKLIDCVRSPRRRMVLQSALHSQTLGESQREGHWLLRSFGCLKQSLHPLKSKYLAQGLDEKVFVLFVCLLGFYQTNKNCLLVGIWLFLTSSGLRRIIVFY